MKSIIINADDFGLSRSINRGIIQAYKEGVLTSSSLLVNMPGFEDAVNLIKDNPGLDIGLHINFFRGRPVMPPDKTATITDAKGFFLQDVFSIATKIYQRRISLKELEAECEAQIKMALDKGINITHLDSEKHLHLISHVYNIVVKLAKKYGINKIRNINEYPYISRFLLNGKHIFNSSLCKTAILQLLSMCRKKINSLNSIKTADYSFGLWDSGSMTLSKYKRLFEHLANGTTEILCHPGYIDEEWRKPPLNREKYYMTLNREEELAALLSPRLKEIIQKLNIRLTNYEEL